MGLDCIGEIYLHNFKEYLSKYYSQLPCRIVLVAIIMSRVRYKNKMGHGIKQQRGITPTQLNTFLAAFQVKVFLLFI